MLLKIFTQMYFYLFMYKYFNVRTIFTNKKSTKMSHSQISVKATTTLYLYGRALLLLLLLLFDSVVRTVK